MSHDRDTAALAAVSALTAPLLGVDVVAAGSAMLGTLIAGAWAEPIESRAQLAAIVVGSSVLACFTVAVLPAFGFDWASTAPQGPLCGAIAAGFRLFLASAVKRGRQLIASFSLGSWTRKAAAASPADDTPPPAPPAGE